MRQRCTPCWMYYPLIYRDFSGVCCSLSLLMCKALINFFWLIELLFAEFPLIKSLCFVRWIFPMWTYLKHSTNTLRPSWHLCSTRVRWYSVCMKSELGEWSEWSMNIIIQFCVSVTPALNLCQQPVAIKIQRACASYISVPLNELLQLNEYMKLCCHAVAESCYLMVILLMLAAVVIIVMHIHSHS